MESRDVAPSVDPALEKHEPVSRVGPVIAPRWLDVDTAAQYLCMTRHASTTKSRDCSCRSSVTEGSFGSIARRSTAALKRR